MIRRALAWLAAALVAIGGAWWAGSRNGAVRADLKTLRKTADNLKTAIEVRNANDAKTDAAVNSDLSRWVRPD